MTHSIEDAMPDPLLANDERTIEGLALTAANGARFAIGWEGCGDTKIIDLASSAGQAMAVRDYLSHVSVTSLMSEGQKDRAPSVNEGSTLSEGDSTGIAADLLTDPTEGTEQLSRRGRDRTRPSMSIAVLTPTGTVASLPSGTRAMKIVVPPETPVGDGGIDIDTAPSKLVRVVCDQFKVNPSRITVWILNPKNRPWNLPFVAEFTDAGTRIELIEAVDFEPTLLAARPVRPNRRIHIVYGVGGLPEGFLAVPYVRWTGGHIFLKPEPSCRRDDEPEVKLTPDQDRSYDEQTMIRSDDCLLAIAGITDSRVVPGVVADKVNNIDRISVCVTSPLFVRWRKFEVLAPLGVPIVEKGSFRNDSTVGVQ